MVRQTTFAVALAAALTNGAALAQSDAAWRPMTFSDMREPSAGDPLQTMVWPDVIREVNDYTVREFKRPLNGKNGWIKALSASFEHSDKTYIVSTALYRKCDSGANNAGSGIERSICPLRVVLIENGVARTAFSGTGCYVDPPDRAMPASNQHDGIQARLDPATGALSLRALIGGSWVAECSQTIPLS